MQLGRIYRARGEGNWFLRYYETVKDTTGRQVRRRACKKLADYGGQYRTEASVRHLAKDVLEPINTLEAPVYSTQTVAGFFEHVFLVEREPYLRPATRRLYHAVFKLMKPHFGSSTLRDFKTSDASRLLLATANKPDGTRRAHGVLKHNKGVLSAVFKHARRTDRIQHDPIRDAELPRGTIFPTYAYSLEEIKKMLKVVKGTTRTLLATAAFTGMRISEICSLRWSDIEGDTINVQRSVWGGEVGPTKRPASTAPVPLVPILKRELAAHRKRNPTGTYIFENTVGKPQDTKVMVTALMGTLKDAGLQWHGFHAFRRGLATNLHDEGVDDLTIAAILRHADVSTTRALYIKRLPQQSVKAMKKLSRAYGD
jgi:integrase